MRAPRLRCLCAAIALVAFGGIGAPAVAEVLGGYGEGAGQLIEPHGLAVARGSGELYVLDTNNHRVEVYTRDGMFERAWGWGVADGRTLALQQCARRCSAGLSGSGAGQLAFAQGIAVDNDPQSSSRGDLYVVDISNHRVEKFSRNGRFLLTFGGHVNKSARRRHDPAAEDVCPVSPGDRCGAGVMGGAGGQFEFPVEGNFIAVGRAGVVYVGDRDRVQLFGPDGAYRSQVELQPRTLGDAGELGGTSGLVVDPHGNMYVIRNGVSGVREYRPDGAPLRTFYDKGEPASPEHPAPALELDGRGGIFLDIFEGERHRIAEFDAAGVEVASFDAGMEDGLHGLAYDQAINRLYILNTNGNVKPPLAQIRVLMPPRPSPFPSLRIAAWLASW